MYILRKMLAHLFLTITLAAVNNIASDVEETKLKVSLSDDPSLFPGHMEPLASKQPRTEIEELTEYPSPQDFFKNYIRPGRPFLLKKGAIYQDAYKLWSDEYMKSIPEAENELVTAEPNHKENREATGMEIPFKEFLERYHKEKIYMVNKVPTFLQKDVAMPPPLRCNNTRGLMLDHVTWMSNGGTKSVVHSDDLDNINCLFRGSKELLFIDPHKYGNKVPIDKPRGGYSSLDVDKVNFTKYPDMREVEYIHCKMEQGDCLFIPWRWIHQVNSAANKNNQNIAVNIWFNHDPDHVPTDCDVPEDKISIDNWKFIGMDEAYGDVPTEDEDPFPLISLFQYLLKRTKHKRANLKTFLAVVTKVDGVFIEETIEDLMPTKEFLSLIKKLFVTLNINQDKFIDQKDFDQMSSKDGQEKDIELELNRQFDTISLLLTKLRTEANLSEDEDESIDEVPEEEMKQETPKEESESETEEKNAEPRSDL